jgi:DNA-binding transcriptional MerR regulator
MTTRTNGYRVRAFARLAGVTVKALRHYERIGLLVPARSDAGHRLYTSRDTEIIRQIVALKALGFPLREVRHALTADSAALVLLLQQRRAALAERERATARAVAAVVDVARRMESGSVSAADGRRMLVEVMDVEQAIERMKKYFDDESWPKARAFYEGWPSPAWRALLIDAQAALSELPASESGRNIAARWRALVEEDAGGRNMLLAGYFKAWFFRDRWPAALLDRSPGVDLDAIGAFINEAAWSAVETAVASRPAPPQRAPDRVGATRLQLFADIAARGVDPSSAAAKMFVDRWRSLVEIECGGDAEVRAALLDAFARRRRLPRGMRQAIAATYDMDLETWERVGDFIEAAANLEP